MTVLTMTKFMIFTDLFNQNTEHYEPHKNQQGKGITKEASSDITV